MKTVIVIRHAQSEWNAENRFSGWANPALTQKGMDDALEAAQFLRDAKYSFDTIYSSILVRAIKTAEIIKQTLALDTAIQLDWRLNERHYGALQGQNKQAKADDVGEKQVWKWRRSYLEHPPKLSEEQHQQQKDSELLRQVPADKVPYSENLAETRERVSGFWREQVQPKLGNRNILLSAHGNTLRALLMELAQMSVEHIESFEIPTSEPIAIDFDDQGRFSKCHYLRGDQKLMLN